MQVRAWVAWAVLVAAAATGCREGNLHRAPANLNALPHAVDFGPAALGVSKNSKVLLRNDGRAPMSITGLRSTSATVEILDSNFLLEGGEEREIEVLFTPEVEGPMRGLLYVETDAAETGEGGVLPIDMSGLGVKSIVETTARDLDFGAVELHTVKVESFEVRNTTEVDAPFTLTIGGGDADQFSSSLVGTHVLAPGEVREVPIAYAPSRLGVASAVMHMERCAGCEPVRVTLTGTGIASRLEITPLTVDFGRVAVGATAYEEVTVRNLGNEPLTFEGAALQGDANGAVKIESVTAHSGQLAVGATARISVSFTPTYNGAISGSLLEVKARPLNQSGPFPRLPVRGEGGAPCLAFLPAEIGFGEVPEGMTITSQVTAQNLCGDEVTLSNLRITTSQGGFFSLAQGPSTLVIPPGQGSPVRISFTPKTGGGQSRGQLSADVTERASVSTATLAFSGSSRVFPPCSYALGPDPLNFGRVNVGSEVTLAATLENTGADLCFVSSFGMASGSDEDFSTGSLPSARLQPGEKIALPVKFRPVAAGQAMGMVEAWVNHPTNGHGTVLVTGNGVNDCFTLEPGTIDFGPTRLTCGPRTRELVARNGCSESVSVTAISLERDDASSTDLSLENPPSLPRSIAPGGSLALRVRYAPSNEGTDTAALRLTLGTGGPYTAGLLGNGQSNPMHTDRWVQQGQAKVDMLFVIDNSGSMMEEQQNLGRNFAALMSAANAAAVDYQIAVTTTGIEASPGGWSQCPGGAEGGEGGRLFPVDGTSPRIITPTTPNAANVFQNNVQVGWCHWNEQGLEAAYRALSTPLVNELDDPRTTLANDGNGGFLRADARLAIVFLTDEEDFSPSPLSHYETFFKAVKNNDASMLTISAIAGPKDLSTCPTASSSGTRYISLADATGGVVENICTSDWSKSLQSLSSNAFGPKRVFPLTQTPRDPADLTVTVNGVPVTSGWTYDAATNSISFDADSAPSNGSMIEATYALGC